MASKSPVRVAWLKGGATGFFSSACAKTEVSIGPTARSAARQSVARASNVLAHAYPLTGL